MTAWVGARILLLPALGALATGGEPLPSSVDLRPRYAELGLAAKSQGKRGCCSLFAINGVLEYELAAQAKGRPVRLSEEYLNWASHRSNGRTTDGSFFSDAIRGVRAFGVCEESLMPYVAEYDPECMPSDAARQDASTRRALRAVWVKHWDVNTGMPDAMVRRIQEELAGGHPVAIGMRWPKKVRFDDSHLLQMPGGPDDVFDGHSIVLVGYRANPERPQEGRFIFRNSSGNAWREAGSAYMPFAYVRAYGNDALSVRIGEGKPIRSNSQAQAPIEIETLPVTAKNDCSPSVQGMKPFGAMLWSAGEQLFIGAGPEAFLELGLTVAHRGDYDVLLYATRAPDFAIVEVSLDGKFLGDAVDLYAPEVLPTGALSLGQRRMDAGEHRLTFRVKGKNRASTGYHFGLDCLELRRR